MKKNQLNFKGRWAFPVLGLAPHQKKGEKMDEDISKEKIFEILEDFRQNHSWGKIVLRLRDGKVIMVSTLKDYPVRTLKQGQPRSNHGKKET